MKLSTSRYGRIRVGLLVGWGMVFLLAALEFDIVVFCPAGAITGLLVFVLLSRYKDKEIF